MTTDQGLTRVDDRLLQLDQGHVVPQVAELELGVDVELGGLGELGLGALADVVHVVGPQVDVGQVGPASTRINRIT